MNNKGADQTARMHSLICSLAIRMQNQFFICLYIYLFIIYNVLIFRFETYPILAIQAELMNFGAYHIFVAIT